MEHVKYIPEEAKRVKPRHTLHTLRSSSMSCVSVADKVALMVRHMLMLPEPPQKVVTSYESNRIICLEKGFNEGLASVSYMWNM